MSHKVVLAAIAGGFFFISMVLSEHAFCTTFRVDAENDISTIVDVFAGSSYYGSSSSSNSDSSSDDSSNSMFGGGCIDVCACCHVAPHKKSVKSRVRPKTLAQQHLAIYMPRLEYHPRKGEKVSVGNAGEYVIRQKSELILVEGEKKTVLPRNSKIIKTRSSFFILDPAKPRKSALPSSK